MAPINSEPECWNCRHFTRRGAQRTCTLHRVVLPIEQGPHLICSQWAHPADAAHAVLWWHRRFLTDDGLLYRYQLYSHEPPQPLAAFKALPPLS